MGERNEKPPIAGETLVDTLILTRNAGRFPLLTGNSEYHVSQRFRGQESKCEKQDVKQSIIQTIQTRGAGRTRATGICCEATVVREHTKQRPLVQMIQPKLHGMARVSRCLRQHGVSNRRSCDTHNSAIRGGTTGCRSTQSRFCFASVDSSSTTVHIGRSAAFSLHPSII